jgi:hypothetical protein
MREYGEGEGKAFPPRADWLWGEGCGRKGQEEKRP